MNRTVILALVAISLLSGGCSHTQPRVLYKPRGIEIRSEFGPMLAHPPQTQTEAEQKVSTFVTKMLIPIGEQVLITILERELDLEPRPGERLERAIYRDLVGAGVHVTRKAAFQELAR